VKTLRTSSRTSKNRKSPNLVGRKGLWKAFFRPRTLGFAVVLLGICAGVFLSFRIYRTSARLFPLREVVFYGNLHLSEGELKSMTGLNTGEGLFPISTKGISEKLLKSPWIKNVSIRKEFPHSVSIRIHESSPFAILEMKGRSFLIDEKGRLLEEMKGAIPFLPVITADPFGDRENFMEVLHLARVLKDKKIAGAGLDVFEKDPIDPDNPLLKMDNVIVTPHSASYCEAAFKRLRISVGQEAVRVAQGIWPTNVVNKGVKPKVNLIKSP